MQRVRPIEGGGVVQESYSVGLGVLRSRPKVLESFGG